jgi:hypothetical protein
MYVGRFRWPMKLQVRLLARKPRSFWPKIDILLESDERWKRVSNQSDVLPLEVKTLLFTDFLGVQIRRKVRSLWLCVLSSAQLTGCASCRLSESLVPHTPPLREAKGWVPRACTAHSHDSNCTNVSSIRSRVATPPRSCSHLIHAPIDVCCESQIPEMGKRSISFCMLDPLAVCVGLCAPTHAAPSPPLGFDDALLPSALN